MRLEELIDGLEVDAVRGDAGVEVADLAYDSAKVGPRTLFFCVRGERADGHEFAAGAVERGAVALVVERELELDVPQVRVADCRAAMAPLAVRFWGDPTGELTVAGITGTNGKTTTTALVAHLLSRAGLKATAAGNIGRPLADVAVAADRYQWLSVEVSSFQLHDSPHFAPDVGIVTNLAPDHLDRYASVDAYYADKRLLFRNATDANVWVLNADDPAVLELARGARGRRALFSVAKPADASYETGTRRLRLGGAELVGRDELHLLGDHNVANALAAALAVHQVGVPTGLIGEGLRSFQALPHRLEPVREVGGVLWINDSKATNIASTVVAIEAMRRPFVLLLGGRHKGEPYTRLGPLLANRARRVIAYGEAGPIVEQDLAGQAPLERGTTFDDVVLRARRAARPGDAVLLSPACSSYDMFKNYEERGATFRRLVEAM